MAVTTLAVVVAPVLAVTALRDLGIIVGTLPLLVAGLTLSLATALAGSAIWRTRPGSGDILFADLIIWGFVRRWLVDRHLSSAVLLLGLDDDAVKAGSEGEGLELAAKAGLLEQLAASMEAQDPRTHGHSRRVARHTATIARRLGLPSREVARIRAAAAIHDVGKINTPSEILTKPGRLSDEEFEVVMRHPVDGARMAGDLEDPELALIIRHHHERLDGGGYPDGLAGEEIPLGSRIIAVADTFDAITSARPYRPAKSHAAALKILRAESGTQLDPEVVEAFHSYYSGLRPVAVWTAVIGIPQRLFPGIFGDLGAGFASSTKAVAAATASVILAAAAANGVGLVQPSSGQADRQPGGAVRTEPDTPGSTGPLAGGVDGEDPGDGGGPGASPGVSNHLTSSSDDTASSPAVSPAGGEPASGNGTSNGNDSPGHDESESGGELSGGTEDSSPAEHGKSGGEHGNSGGEHGNSGGEHGNSGGEHGNSGGEQGNSGEHSASSEHANPNSNAGGGGGGSAKSEAAHASGPHAGSSEVEGSD